MELARLVFNMVLSSFLFDGVGCFFRCEARVWVGFGPWVGMIGGGFTVWVRVGGASGLSSIDSGEMTLFIYWGSGMSFMHR